MTAAGPRSVEIQNSEHWHHLRSRCVVTASTVAALVSGHPYETPLSIYHRAAGGYVVEPENEAMACGSDAELMMPARVRRVRPDLLLTKSSRFFVHPHLRFGGTPDFFDQFGGTWQGKCVHPAVFSRDWGNEPPLWVLLQLQAEMLLTGAPSGGVICLVRDATFTTCLYEVEPHTGAQQAIERAVAEMQRRVEQRDPPPPDFTKDASLIADLYGSAVEGKFIDLTGDNYLSDLCAEYLAASRSERDAKARRDAIKAEILTKIGDAAKARCGSFSISANEIGPTHVSYERKGYRDLRIFERTAS